MSESPLQGSSSPTPMRQRRRFMQEMRRRAKAWRQRERTQDVVYGMLAAALALALPAREPLTSGGEAAARLAGDQSVITQGLLFPFARGVHEVFEVEDPAVTVGVLAALAFGGALAMTLTFLRGLGFRRSACVPAAFAAFACPYAWGGATSPVDFAFGLLGSAVLLWTLFDHEQSMKRGYHWRAILYAGLAYMLHLEMALVIPAVAVAVARHPEYRREGSVNFLAVLAVLLMSVAIGLSGKAQMERVQHLQVRALAGADDFSLTALGGWLVELPIGLGVVLFGIYQLLFAARSVDAKRAPVWMVPWCLAALAPVVAGHPDAAPIAPYLVPAGALGIADWLNRRAGGSAREQLWGLGLALLQVIATAAAITLVSRT